MFTVCPKCALTLVVTAADLRIAQGYVRCGRCSSVFNSLPHLTDERPPPLPPEPPPAEAPLALDDTITAQALTEEPAQDAEGDTDAAGAGARAAEQQAAADEAAPAGTGGAESDLPHSTLAAEQTPGAAYEVADATGPAPDEDTGSQATIPEEALEFNPDRTDAAAVFVAAPPDPEWTAATGTFKALSAAKPAAGDSGEVDSTYLAAMLRAPATAGASPASASQPAATEPLPLPEPATGGEATGPAAPEDLLGEAPAARPAVLSRIPRGVWRAAVPLAALLLLAQVIHHNRDQLAVDPRFNRPLAALYGALGVGLVPSWDLRAYDVRQLGAEASPAGSGLITVHASIKNGAAQRQPLPLLRVTLQDRFGNRVAARDVAPGAYLPPAAATMSSLSAGQRVDATMGFVDPGANAVGFEIDACLPASAGGIACANDAGAR
jgi:predicted Zn finger-like uncharacterized protein